VHLGRRFWGRRLQDRSFWGSILLGRRFWGRRFWGRRFWGRRLRERSPSTIAERPAIGRIRGG
jgi:hypothetical protein